MRDGGLVYFFAILQHNHALEGAKHKLTSPCCYHGCLEEWCADLTAIVMVSFFDRFQPHGMRNLDELFSVENGLIPQI